ncbi:MAG: hypothetical protein H6726_27500 [Sandaracinaceae bacterium]|nr:hypothetical protein [Sandaracinaceae bacterium]
MGHRRGFAARCWYTPRPLYVAVALGADALRLFITQVTSELLGVELLEVFCPDK